MPRVLSVLVALSGLLLACSPSTQTSSDHQQVSSSKPLPKAPVAQSCDLTALPTRDKLAQLLTVGVTDGDDARKVVSEQHVGGIMIGSWTDLSMLSDGSLKEIADAAGPLPLAVSVDEEGGRVSRLASIIGKQPSPRVLAQTNTADEVYGIALERGKKMHDLGITVDFAPVVDVTDAPDDTVIGDRSFGDDPAKVTEYAGAYARGLRDAGILPVLKHFPGHGHGSGDSHTNSVTTPPLAVMVGHLEVPGLTGTDPASLSAPAYELLRSGNYGGPPFNGLVYTDDLSSMAAINERYGVSAAVLKALQAGADNALWITTKEVPAVLDGLEKAVAAGELSMDNINASLQRNSAIKGPVRCGG
jgi:beta-N-acetylhexosaminidase